MRASAWSALPRPQLWGHRGSRDGAPENTLEAIERAAPHVHGVEIDVRLSADCVVMVAHDPTLARVAGDDRGVATLSASELRTVDLGGGARMPTLAETLALCRERGVALNVEMKRDVPDRLTLVRATLACLGREPPPRALVLSSFDPFMLAAARALAPAVPRALLIARARRSRRLGPLAPVLGADAIHLDRELPPDRWLRGRRRLVVWTVNEPAEARLLLARGVDGIITDRPALMRRELAGWLAS